uniref:hypothetical protein n=1 Tax=uncultured Bifidobacterium sp. TaxID=165187 RepID=UPI0026076369
MTSDGGNSLDGQCSRSTISSRDQRLAELWNIKQTPGVPKQDVVYSGRLLYGYVRRIRSMVAIAQSVEHLIVVQEVARSSRVSH